MARPLNPVAIKQRIKTNTAIMREAKKEVMEVLNAGLKAVEFDATLGRASLAKFIKSSKAVMADTEKLNLIKGEN